jgi:hypothetical protein
MQKKKWYHYILVLKKDLYLTMHLCAHYNTFILQDQHHFYTIYNNIEFLCNHRKNN